MPMFLGQVEDKQQTGEEEGSQELDGVVRYLVGPCG